MGFNIGDRVIIDKGADSELTGCIVGESTLQVLRGFHEQSRHVYIIELDHGGYLRPPMAKVDEVKGYVSVLVVHADNLTLEPE